MSSYLHYDIRGNEHGETLVCIHGWPDDASLWKHQLATLETEYRCVLITLPNFGDAPYEQGGCSIPQLMKRLERTIDKIESKEQILFLAHDWGAILAYLYEKNNPQRVRSMVVMDVGGRWIPSPREVISIVFYQWTLIGCWFVGGVHPKLGTDLARRFTRKLGAPEDHVELIESKSIYIYFYFWRMSLFPFLSLRYLLTTYEPQCPVLFLYGEKKPIRFHSQLWFDILDRCSGRSVGFKNGDHWFMDTHFEQVNPMIMEWFSNGRNLVSD